MSFLKIYTPKSIDEFSFNNDITNYFTYCIDKNNFKLLIHGNSGVGKTSFLNVFTEKYIQHIYETNTHNLTIEDIKKHNILTIVNIQKININTMKKYVLSFCKSSVYYKKKLIIIDDLDEFDDCLQNLFSKLIETYSNNVNFLMSCNILQNIIPKIQSQSVKFKLHSMEKKNMIHTIKNILQKENIIKSTNDTMNEKIYSLLCNKTNGNITNILVQLQKIKFSKLDITLETIQNIIYLFNNDFFDIFMKHIESIQHTYDFEEFLFKQLHILEKNELNGYSILDFLENFYNYLKQIYDTFHSSYIHKNDILQIQEVILYYIDKFYDTEESFLNEFFLYDIYAIFEKR